MSAYLDIFNIYIMGSIQMLMGFHFFAGFLGKKIKPVHYILFLVPGIAMIMFIPTGGIIEFLAYILLLTAWGIYRCREKYAAVVLYAVVTVEIMQLCYGIFNSALCVLYPLLPFSNLKLVGSVFMVSELAALLLSVLCYLAVNKHFLLSETDDNRYALMLFIPVLMIFLTGQYISFTIYGNTITTDGSEMIIDANHYQMLVIQLLGLASLFCILFAYKKLLEHFRLRMEMSLLKQEEHSLHRYVEEARERYEKTKSFRHDIKNHITVLKELLMKGESERALKYIGDMEHIAADLSFPCNTGNPVVDILLSNKLGIAQRNGITVRCSLDLPHPCMIRDIDFCIILSNALDNAIQACKKESADKYIDVVGRMQGDFILLEVENSFRGTEALRPGTGLANIKAVAEKYYGTMRVKMQDTAFVLSVLLIIPQQTDGIPQQSC